MTKKQMTFEDAVARLEEIIENLESGDMDLDKSLKLYEEGIGIVAKCSDELEAAKRKIKVLQQGKDGGIELAELPEGTFNS